MRIAEAARATGVTARALRWYEEQGLISPRRTPSGYRDYGDDDLQRVRSIRILQATGFTLADLTTFSGLLGNPATDQPATRTPAANCATAIATTRARLSNLDRHLAELQTLRERLTAILEDPTKLTPATHCPRPR